MRWIAAHWGVKKTKLILKKRDEFADLNEKVFWQLPTLPGGYPPSTIGVCGLNDRVRDVAGCTTAAKVTKRLVSNYK